MKRVTLKLNIDETGKVQNPNEVIENYLLMGSSPKIRQKVDILRNSDNLQKKVEYLRKKWSGFVKEYNYCIKKIGGLMPLEQMVKFSKEGNRAKADLLPPPSPTQRDKNIAQPLGEKIQRIFLDDEFDQDAINLAREEKLSPVEYWKEVIKIYILMKIHVPVTYFLKLGLANSFLKNETFKVSPDLNFPIKAIENERTKEQELFTQITEDTSLGDYKKNWNLISAYQKKMRERKGIKRYYPLKNLGIEKELKKLDKRGEPDSIKQEKIYGEITGLKFGEEENKRMARLRQIRHRSKKRTSL